MSEKNETAPEGTFIEEVKALLSLGREWAELGLERSRAEIEYRSNRLIAGLILAVLGVLFILFLMITLALFLGQIFGDVSWGFLVVSGILLFVMVLVKVIPITFWRFKPPRSSEQPSEEAKNEVLIPPATETPRLTDDAT